MALQKQQQQQKKKFSLPAFITAVTIFRCPASWSGHSFSLDVGGACIYKTAGQAFWIFMNSLPIKQRLQWRCKLPKEDWLQLLIWLRGCQFFIACPLENHLMGPSVSTNDTAECHGPEQCRNSKGLLTFLYHFGAGCSAMPELITRAQLTIWSSPPTPEQTNHTLSYRSQRTSSMINLMASSQ